MLHIAVIQFHFDCRYKHITVQRMPPQRGKKKKVNPSKTKNKNQNDQSDNGVDSEDETLKRVLEESKLDFKMPHENSAEDEDEDFKKALEMSRLDAMKAQNDFKHPDSSVRTGSSSSGVTNLASGDEFDDMCAGPSNSLKERINSSSIIIESDQESSVLAVDSSSILVSDGGDSSVIETPRRGWLDAEEPSEDEEDESDS